MKYAVALFLQDHKADVIKQRLYQFIVDADSPEHAIGIIIRDPKRPDKMMPIAYHIVTEIKETPDETE